MNSKRIVHFYPLTFVKERNGVSVGRYGTEQFAIFPEDGAALIKKLQFGLTIFEAAQWYETTYHETVDMEDFLNTLQDLGFLCEDEHAENPSVPAHLISLGKAAFSPYAWFVYILLFLGSMYFMYRLPSLHLNYQNVFFSSYLMAVQIGLLVGQIPGLFFHELFHMLAGWRKGIPSRFSIGRRLYLIVFETSMSGIWGLQRKERYLPYLAGMVGDIVWFSLLTSIAGMLILSSGYMTLTASFLVAIAYTTFLRFIWQFFFYLKTDIYYAISNSMGCINLQQVTQEYLKNKWFRFIGSTHKLKDESSWPETDRTVARWYAWLYGGGWLATWAVLLLVAVPAIEHALLGLWPHLTNETLEANPHHFWDSVLFILLTIFHLCILAWIALKERKSLTQSSK